PRTFNRHLRVRLQLRGHLRFTQDAVASPLSSSAHSGPPSSSGPWLPSTEGAICGTATDVVALTSGTLGPNSYPCAGVRPVRRRGRPRMCRIAGPALTLFLGVLIAGCVPATAYRHVASTPAPICNPDISSQKTAGRVPGVCASQVTERFYAQSTEEEAKYD